MPKAVKAAAQVTLLHVVDRSRLQLGWGKCLRARFLEYHGGPTGYGIRLKREAMPLATGSAVHEGLADIITYRMTAPPGDRVDAYREAIKLRVESYRRLVVARGFQETEGEGAEEVARIVKEQCSLIQGMLWGFIRIQLEPLFDIFQPIAVEQEEEYVVSCTCGLGDGVGDAKQHELRACHGYLVMTKPDLLLQRKSDNTVHYVEFKSLGQDSMKWRKKFELQSVQLALGAVGAERRLGEKINFAWVYGLVKGWRYSAKDPVTGEKGKGPRMQDSVYCYAYKRPPNPPFDHGEWQYAYDYVDEAGSNRKATESKGFVKTLVTSEFRSEDWVAALPEDIVRKNYVILGPLETPRELVPQMLRGIAGQEQRVLEGLYAMHDAREAGHDDAALQALKDYHFPQSFLCVNEYGYVCQFARICKGGEAEDAVGNYELRRPHHKPELEQVLARGIELPPEQMEEEEEE